ncbi:NADPH-dependent FMN reductase [Arhodomonas sp. AD133]|uniref:NADPH-dependent FMN reductase n=1 Tax=Arhodomonas sp. AD133 TaxID=3415009 RepID=UPI003EB827D5
MRDRIRLAVIYGSTREGRFCDVITQWVLAQLGQREDFTVDVIDPAGRSESSRPWQAGHASWRDRLDAADAFIVVTPEYNHSYPAALKSFVDGFKQEWAAKPVAFVSYGGLSGGIRAVEHLRTVFAELHAVGIRDSVPFLNAWDQFRQDGTLRAPERAERAMATMLARLAWWGKALRDGRLASDYAEATA